MTKHRNHVFWAEGVDLTQDGNAPLERVMGCRQITDAYLLCMALAHSGRLATLDRGISALVPSGAPPESVVQIPV